MRIVVLGGCGEMGRGATEDLLAHTDAEVVIADYRTDDAKAYASQLGSRATSAFVDANDADSLASVLHGADAAVGAIGPFYHYAVKVATAAVNAGVNYVDICDDHTPLAQLFDLDSAARASACTVITGLGWTPGITNLMCRAGASQLQSVEEIRAAWAGGSHGPSGLAVLMHVFHCFTGEVPTYDAGGWKMVPAASGRELVDFGDSVGKLTVFHCGHPEPLTLPRYIATRKISLKGTLTPAWNNALSDSFMRLWLSVLHRAGITQSHDRMEKLARALYRMERRFGTVGVPYAAARVDVIGRCGGEPCTCSYRVVDKMRRLTGIPVAVGAHMLARGQINRKGVFAPEGCLDPKQFFSELARRQIRIEELSPAQMVAIP